MGLNTSEATFEKVNVFTSDSGMMWTKPASSSATRVAMASS